MSSDDQKAPQQLISELNAERARVAELEKQLAARSSPDSGNVVGGHSQSTLQALRDSEERYNLAIAGANDGIWDWNRETDAVFFSPRWKEIIGYEDHEIRNDLEEWQSRIHPDDYAKVMKANDIFLTSDKTHFEVEYRLRHKDGDYRWILGRGTCLRNEKGEPFRMAGAHTDITKRKNAERELVNSEAQKQAILDGIDASIIFLNADFEILWANKHSAKIVGASVQSLLGRKCHSIWYDHDSACEGCPAVRVFSSLTPEHAVVHLEDGRVLDLHSEPVFGQDGELLGVVEIARNITTFIQAQKNAETAQEEAERANRLKSQFLANMSHEIRTPVNGVMGMLQLMKNTQLSEFQDQYVEHAMDSCKRLTKLLSDILDISKVEAGKLTVQAVEFCPQELLFSIHALFSSMAEQNNVRLLFDVDDSIPPVLIGDINRLHQILSNLIGNALKFTEAGDVTIKATLTEPADQASERCEVQFTISDTGKGIPADLLPHVFEPFTQAGGESQHQGAGLGLAIAKRLVDLMGGTMTVQSEPGAGTVFHLLIPFETSAAHSAPTSSTQEIVQETPPSRKTKALVVEDDPINMLTLVKLLELLNIESDEAENGAEALELVKVHNYDLILMDIQMQVMDGVKATKIIRSDPEFSEKSKVPIIALTAYAMAEDRKTFLDAGMDDYLPKPIEMEVLDEAIQRVLKKNK